MPINRLKKSVLSLAVFVTLSSLTLNAQSSVADPPRAGDPLPGLSTSELAYFNAGKAVFIEEEAAGPETFGHKKRHRKNGGGGLGPRFNSDSCGGCHAQPAVGGSSPAINPQVAVATKLGARNVLPYFISLTGPVREARFKFNPDGSRDGGVTNLFVISGRSDAPGCNINQPNFDQRVVQNNITFRIPTPTFGDGLIEAISDTAILQNKNADQDRKRQLGISGHENRNGNDGTITRFGWKAQNKSLLVFSGEAYNVEQGVTNEVFNQKRDETASCVYNPLPEDHTNLDGSVTTESISDVLAFTEFMRFLAPPTPKPLTPTAQHGSQIFASIGCGMCHTPSFTTGTASSPALTNKPVNLYSDLLVHDMGQGLADNIIQGLAGPEEFRTAPLWGLSQRLFFLHDGRANNIVDAIRAHQSQNSEANRVIGAYNGLSTRDKNDLLEFLQSL